MTTEPGVFTAGDMQRGQSLIVWAIADGRNAAFGRQFFERQNVLTVGGGSAPGQRRKCLVSKISDKNVVKRCASDLAGF